MLTLAILAGGSSSRMGQDKALIPLQGQPLVQRVLDRLSPIAAEVILSTNTPAAFSFLNIATLPDEEAGQGALGGLRTVLKAAAYPFVAAVACDMPFASAKLFEYELDLIQKTEADVVIPFSADGLEPLHAVYRCEACLPVIEKTLKAGNYRMTEWLDEVNVQIVPLKVGSQFDPGGWAFWNLNTREEFAEAKKEIARREREKR